MKKTLILLVLFALFLTSLPVYAQDETSRDIPVERVVDKNDKRVKLFMKFIARRQNVNIKDFNMVGFDFSNGTSVIMFIPQKIKKEHSIYIVSYSQDKNTITSVLKKDFDFDNDKAIIYDLITNKVEYQDMNSSCTSCNSSQSVQQENGDLSDSIYSTQSTCPPGYFEYIECRQETYIDWVVYAACVYVTRNPVRCIATATSIREVCVSDCYPLDGGEPV